jgi:hypothetical protein
LATSGFYVNFDSPLFRQRDIMPGIVQKPKVIIIFYRLHLIMVVILCMHAATLGQTVGAAQNPPAPLGKLVDVGGYRVHRRSGVLF